MSRMVNNMAKLTEKMIKDNAKVNVSEKFASILSENEAIQIGDFSWAICDNEELDQWVSIELKAKNRKSTKVTPAFDPIAKHEEWVEETKIKEEERKAKELAKKRKAKK